MLRGLKHLCNEKRMTEFSLEKSWLCGDLVVAFQYLKGANILSRPVAIGQGVLFKLKGGRFGLDTRKIFFNNESGET